MPRTGSALVALLCALAGCGGGGSGTGAAPGALDVEAACQGVRGRGTQEQLASVGGLSARELCRARGRPLRARVVGTEVRWSYPCGVDWPFDATGRTLHRLRIRGKPDLTCGPAPEVDQPVAAPPSSSPDERGAFGRGQTVAEQSGCKACHRIGRSGNAGPGRDLSAVGARLDPAQLRRSLVAPQAPMPSFSSLDPAELDDLVAFLSGLRGDRRR